MSASRVSLSSDAVILSLGGQRSVASFLFAWRARPRMRPCIVANLAAPFLFYLHQESLLVGKKRLTPSQPSLVFSLLRVRVFRVPPSCLGWWEHQHHRRGEPRSNQLDFFFWIGYIALFDPMRCDVSAGNEKYPQYSPPMSKNLSYEYLVCK